MKKLIVFLLIISTLFSTMAFKNQENVLFSIEGLEKVCFVCDFEIVEEGVESVESGDLFFNYCVSGLGKVIYKKYHQRLQALQFYYVDVEAENLIERLKIDVVERGEVEQIEVCFGYSPYLSKSYLLDGKKVNVQLAVTEEFVIVGNPIILTGY